MVMIRKTCCLLALAGLAACSLAAAGERTLAPGDVVVLNEEEIASERSEVRFRCPRGSVVTGIGARAHYDNFTTFWVVHRPLRRDGTLGPPQEAHVGSEPDHVCEALVRLPDPYVACGFGARGAPEWDITTLWVWARPLEPGGTLGPVKIFKDGFQPEHEGLERKALDERPGRVLTGCGLRFASNDVAGIWAVSGELFRVGGEGLEVKAALFDRPGPGTAGAERVIRSFFPACEIRRDEAGTHPAPAEDRYRFVQLGEEIGLPGALPYFRAYRVAYLLLEARTANRPVVLGFASGGSLAGKVSLSRALLRVAKGLEDRVAAAPSAVLEEWAAEKFGKEAEPVLAVLLRGEALCRRTLTLGEVPLWRRGEFVTWEAFRAGFDHPTRSFTKRFIDGVMAEKRYVLGELGRIRADLAEREGGLEPRQAAGVAAVRERFERLRALGEVAASAAGALLWARLYTLDAAAATEESFAGRLEDLKGRAAACPFGDLGPLVASLEKARREAAALSPLERALAGIERLLAAGDGEDAARALRDLFENPNLSRHVFKHRHRVAAMVGSLPVLWDGEPPGDVRIMWGGDGKFALVERAGRWAIMTTKRGPVAYGGWARGKMEEPQDLVMTFSYLDLPGQTIFVHYNSDFPGGLEDREYHPAEAVKTTGTGTWRSCRVMLPRALFQGRQNEEADFRFIGRSSGIVVRDIRITKAP
jgi:hypothetical protein